MKFIGKICRFKGMINQNLFELIKDDLLENLIMLYGKTIQKITQANISTLEVFDIFFKTFITFESFANMTSLLEFNIDVSFVNSQNIVKDF